ncbi:hypothetical protein CK203_086255 [Vitis vinifera]|uniref:Reverse transcriptase Ty1/copia-type domain-containing protein n=1 Tax=Vitis vinifera TaxID=29760 RepID=A0A438EEB9_VITVI|nr:hypothetical protein CK203_086255 [Vitis vinifera]
MLMNETFATKFEIKDLGFLRYFLGMEVDVKILYLCLGNLVTWKSNKQSFVARGSVEAEFKALTQGICEILLLKLALEELKVSHGDPMKLIVTIELPRSWKTNVEKLVNGVVSCIVVGDMLLRERARECESEGEGDGDEGDNQMEKRRKRQGRVSGWNQRLGLASARIFLEGLDRCVKDGKEDKWEKGRSYSMVCEVNKAGSFIRYGGGCTGLIARLDRREEKKEESIPVRLQAEMGKRWGNRGSLLVRMEVEGEEISRNVNRLGHCLVGKWNLGCRRRESGEALLEFELVKKAGNFLPLGKGRWVGLGRSGALESKLRVFGRRGNKRRSLDEDHGLANIALVPSILRRVGDECGGFVAMDPSTEKWKTSGGLGSW